MIITRTPFRMSYVGGGSDLPSFYREHGGAVVSSAINKYIYVTVNEKFDDSIRVSYSKTEEVEKVEDIQHPIVRAALRLQGVTQGIEITSIADIPSRGTGLGSSSSFTVGLLHAISAFNKKFASAEQLASQACQIEIEHCKEPIGKQDQYAAAYGGLNFIQFNPDDSVFVDPIICAKETLDCLNRNTLVFYTGIARSASEILKAQQTSIKSDRKRQDAVKRMVRLAHDLKDELQRNNLDAFGEILHENWVLKKSLAHQVSTSEIDGWYEAARSEGALGGKLLGAGSGGFLMFFAPEEKHALITRRLSGLRPMKFAIEPQGSKVIFVY